MHSIARRHNCICALVKLKHARRIENVENVLIVLKYKFIPYV